MERAEIKQHSLIKLNWLSSDKLAWLISAGYMVLTFTYLFRRHLHNNIAGLPIIEKFHALCQGVTIPLLLLMFLVSAYPNSRVVKWLNSISNKKLIYPIGYIILTTCVILTLTEVRGLWWTWFSAGLIIAIILLVIASIGKELMPIEKAIIAGGIASLWIGIWEIPYQIGLKLTYDASFPQVTSELVNHMIAYEVMIELPLILGGFAILWYYQDKYGNIVKLNRYFILFIATYIALITAWYATGFWVDIHYDWGNSIWVYTNNFDKTSMAIYKASKVALALSLVALIWRGKGNYKKGETE